MDFFGDLRAFIELGQSARAGGYSGWYPYPFALLWAVLSFFPYPILLVALFGASVAIIVWIFKRRAFLWLLYIPILHSFILGQLSVVWLGLMNAGTGLSLALLTLKPHVFIIALPILADRWPKVGRSFLTWCAVLYLPSFVIRPSWLFEWLGLMTGDGRMINGATASIWSAPVDLAAIIALALVAVAILRRPRARHVWQALTTAFNPAALGYDYTMLSGATLWLIPMSWIAWVLARATGQGWPFALLGMTVCAVAMKRVVRMEPISVHYEQLPDGSWQCDWWEGIFRYGARGSSKEEALANAIDIKSRHLAIEVKDSRPDGTVNEVVIRLHTPRPEPTPGREWYG